MSEERTMHIGEGIVFWWLSLFSGVCDGLHHALPRSLRIRTLLSIGISCCIMTVLLFISSQMIVMGGFAALEEGATIQNVERAENAMNGEITKLEAIAFTWARAEETNTFIESRDHAYFQSVFSDEKFTGANLNIILFIDRNGEILNHKYINLDYGHVMPTPRSLLSQISEHGMIDQKGILVLGSGPMLIATSAIRRGGAAEPSGTILVGRYLDSVEMKALSDQTDLVLSVFENHNPNLPSDIREVQALLPEGDSISVSPLDDHTVAGYMHLYDLNGDPALTLKVEMPRDIFKNGQAAIQYSLLSLVLLGIISGAVTMVLMEKTVLSPLSLLNTRITAIRQGQSLSQRVDFRGENEIAQVASAVDRMLDSLERSQDLLKQSEERFRHLFNDAHDMIFTTDRDGLITSTNNMAELLTGYTKAEMIGRPISLLLSSDRNDGEHGTQSSEVIIRTKTGRERVLDLHTQPRIMNGESIGSFGIARDITEKRRVEEELSRYRNHLEELVRERTTELSTINHDLITEIEKRTAAEEESAAERERLAVTLSSITDGVITTDMKSEIILINNPAADLIGSSPDLLIHQRINAVLALSNEEGERIRIDTFIQQAIGEGRPITLSKGLYLKGSEETAHPIEFSTAPISDRSKETIGCVLVIRDISERRRHEEELIKIEKLESIGLLAGGIAHDFNNILTAITGNLMIARMELPEASSALDRIERAEEATLRARDMTRQLITFAKGGAPVKETSDISTLIKETTLFVLQGTSSKAEITIDPHLSNADVDCGQISQVISNLVINANQAMRDGGIISVTAKNRTLSEGTVTRPAGKYLLISVSDQGCGISAENLKRIFDPYFTTKKTGNGLGLASCLSIINKHGGTIDVESEEGRGTTFSIYLPASGEKVQSASYTLQDEVVNGGSILVMDDDEAILDIASVILTQRGYEVAVARDGDEAIALYREREGDGRGFDAVLMDLTIPGGMGGKEAINILRREFPDIRAIVSSGYSDDPVMSSYREYGFSAVLEKPYRGRDLICLLDRLIRSGSDAGA